MVRRRGELEIFMDILNLASKEARITQIMYKANLSYSTLRKYLSAGLENELICKVNNSDGYVVYCTTEKGKVLLEKLKEVKCSLRR